MVGKLVTTYVERKWRGWEELICYRDSYHDHRSHNVEEAGPYASRSLKRYDPETRRYVRWSHSENWSGQQFEADPNGGPMPIAFYPRFTENEWRKLSRLERQGKRLNPRRMGSDWNWNGPEVRNPISTFQERTVLRYYRDFSNAMTGSGKRHTV